MTAEQAGGEKEGIGMSNYRIRIAEGEPRSIVEPLDPKSIEARLFVKIVRAWPGFGEVKKALGDMEERDLDEAIVEIANAGFIWLETDEPARKDG